MSSIFFFCCCFLFLLGCQDKNNQSTTLFVGREMTIDYRIVIGKILSQKEKAQVEQEIGRVFQEVDSLYNDWNPESEISQLNNLEAYVKRSLSQEMNLFLTKTADLVKLTEGRFDPTIAPLYKLWKSKLEKNSIPSPEELQEMSKVIGWEKIHLEEGSFYKEDRRCSLDLGGVAKGHCVDLLIQSLIKLGYENTYVEWGGEIRTIGHHPTGRPWRVYITRLDDINPHHSPQTLELKDQAVATSGDYMRFWSYIDTKGTKTVYYHIVNPQTLALLKTTPISIASASVVASNCMLADCLAKAAMMFETVEEAILWGNQIRKDISGVEFYFQIRCSKALSEPS